jgi:hypothetical protein
VVLAWARDSGTQRSLPRPDSFQGAQSFDISHAALFLIGITLSVEFIRQHSHSKPHFSQSQQCQKIGPRLRSRSPEVRHYVDAL